MPEKRLIVQVVTASRASVPRNLASRGCHLSLSRLILSSGEEDDIDTPIRHRASLTCRLLVAWRVVEENDIPERHRMGEAITVQCSRDSATTKAASAHVRAMTPEGTLRRTDASRG